MGVWACTASPVCFCTFCGGASSVCVMREDDTASFRAEWCRAARPVHPGTGGQRQGDPSAPQRGHQSPETPREAEAPTEGRRGFA